MSEDFHCGRGYSARTGMSLVSKLLPASATPDAARLIAARMVRSFADGLVSVLLPSYLVALGFDAVRVGGIATATMLGSAALTLLVGLRAHRHEPRPMLFAACGLMLLTGIGFAALGFAHVAQLAPLLVIAVVGTLNPSAGDVSVFLPLEQAALASAVDARDHAALYARSNVAANAMGALGALSSAFPIPLARTLHVSVLDAMSLAFVVYALAAALALLLYTGLSRHSAGSAETPRAPLVKSRRIVLVLSMLFTLDSFAGGFVVQSLLALWLFQRFHFSLADAAGFFFATQLLSGASQLLSPVVAKKIGLIPTMVFTHLPANLFLITAAFMPTPQLAVLFLLLRMSLASMDVPARQAFVMAAVPAEERAAAASVTNVPRSLGTGLAPLLSGYLLAASNFGWPLVIAGSLKAVYDLLLLLGYRNHAASRM
jgi:MFS family permease